MQDDPKTLNDEEKARLLQEMKKSQDSQTIEKVEPTTPPTSPDKEKEPTWVSPKALKEIFDKMVELDSDPTSKRAQDYYQKLEEMERINPNKKKG